MEAAVLRTACMFIEPLQDRQLVQRLKLRDPNAMMDPYDSYARLLYSIILRAVNNSALAEDLTQEAFLRIWNPYWHLRSRKGQTAGLARYGRSKPRVRLLAVCPERAGP